MDSFSDRLVQAILDRNTPVCVGLDPVIDLLPAGLVSGDAGRDEVAAAFSEFCATIVDAIADLVPAVKVQVAFFERYGPAGIEALERTVSHARDRGLVVIADAKRSDIGNTAQAYADYFLGAPPLPGGRTGQGLGADALTVNPYLGPESLEPFAKACRDHGRGLFLLVRTTNPSADRLQELRTMGGRTVAEEVAGFIAHLAPEYGRLGYRDVGAVVAGNVPAAARLRDILPGVLFLVPGYGAQGGTASDVASLADERGLGIVVNASRSLIYAHRMSPGRSYAAACRDATTQMVAEIRSAIASR